MIDLKLTYLPPSVYKVEDHLGNRHFGYVYRMHDETHGAWWEGRTADGMIWSYSSMESMVAVASRMVERILLDEARKGLPKNLT
jgi:hypothetical protein